ncbi:MAG: DUF892 family protein [Sphingobacterium sp.]
MATENRKGKMPNAHLHQLFVDELRDILGAERQLLKGLKKLKASAKGEKLQDAFDQHYVQTEGHIERLKEVFSSLDMSARGKKCKAMEGLLNETAEIIEDFQDSPDILDAALIAAAQKVEHYEIASYGCLATYAELMNHQHAKKLLGQTLTEEKETDELLTKIAMQEANV